MQGEIMSLLKLNKYHICENTPTFLLSILPIFYRTVLFLSVLFIGMIIIPAFAATDTKLTGDDNYAGRFPIGFNFKLYDNSYNHFYVSTNGLIQFSNPTKRYNNQSLPTDFNHTLYVFWDDLVSTNQASTNATIEYQTLGEAPNRKLVVQWNNSRFFTNNAFMGTFQAILYENSQQIKYQYRHLEGEQNKGNSATIGIQGDKHQFAQAVYNQPILTESQQAITFTPLADGSYAIDMNAPFEFIDISSAIPPQIDKPNPVARYTNTAPTWQWSLVEGFSTYEISIANQQSHDVIQAIVGNVDHYTYLDGKINNTTYLAKIRGKNSDDTWSQWSEYSELTTVDTTLPTVNLTQVVRLAADRLSVNYSAYDALSGINAIVLELATDSQFTDIINRIELAKDNNTSVINHPIITGKLYARLSATDKAGNQSLYSDIKDITLAAPLIITPISDIVTHQAQVTVTGQTYSNATLYFTLDDNTLDTTTTSDETGYFSILIPLNNEGEHSLSVMAKTEFGNTPTSQLVRFNYQITAPIIKLITPIDNAVLTTTTAITLTASDEVGIAYIDIYADEQLLSHLTKPPYQYDWQLTHKDNGHKIIKAIATNTHGKTSEESINVTVDMDPPPPPPTIYTGKLDTISPSVSYGQPITITGWAIERESGAMVKNTPLRLVLMNSGFKRIIAINTDEDGHFSYDFTPLDSDKGNYTIAIIHPNETLTPELGEFTINRLSLNNKIINLNMSPNVPAKIAVNITSNLGAKGIYWKLRAQDQSDKQLPIGITFDSGNTLDLEAAQTTTMNMTFTANETTPEEGEFTLSAFAQDSGEIVRAKLTIRYKLSPATPVILVNPNIIETGIAQNESLIESITFSNKGLKAAENVQLRLLDQQGDLPPTWIFISSQTDLGTLAVGQPQEVDITIRPDNNVAEGIYHYLLHISADNHISFTLPVSVAVVQNGTGAIRFDVIDIYTSTLDNEGNPILGVAGAKIKLQNEAALTQQYTLETDSQGIATTAQIPPGIYLYRVSASQHQDKGGRVRVRPGVTRNEHIFIEYNTVNIDFDIIESSIEDIYDIEIDITYQTQVPAPVIVMEPMAINLAGLRQGEEKTGVITISNYGLIRADNFKITLPQSDDQFSYEFFGEIPTELAAKTRLIIPYRIVAKQNIGNDLNRLLRSACGYSANYESSWDYKCPDGNNSSGSSHGSLYYHWQCGGGSPADGSGTINLGGKGSSSAQGTPLSIGCGKNASPCPQGSAETK